MLLTSFLKMESFSFIQELTVLFEVRFKIFSEKKKKIQKIAEITLTATKIGYFTQFGIFGKIDGSRKSQKPQINLLIDFHFLLTNCKRKKMHSFKPMNVPCLNFHI